MKERKIIAVDLDGVLGSHLTAILKYIKPINGSQEAIDRLKQNYELRVVTARYPLFRHSSIEWINRNFNDCFKSIEFVKYKTPFGPRTSKAVICKQIGATIIIDDKLRNAVDCSKAGIMVYFFGEDNNLGDDVLAKDIIKVKDWQAVLKQLV